MLKLENIKKKSNNLKFKIEYLFVIISLSYLLMNVIIYLLKRLITFFFQKKIIFY